MYIILHSQSLHSATWDTSASCMWEFWSYDMQWSLTGLCLRQVLRSLRESQHEDTSSRKESSSRFLCYVYQHCITCNRHLTYSLTYSTSPKLPNPEHHEYAKSHAEKKRFHKKEKYKEIIFRVLSQLKRFYFNAVLPKFSNPNKSPKSL